jgi:filamentous hemagglutinin
MIVRATRSPSDVARKTFKRGTLLVGASLVVLLGTMAKADARALGGGSGGGSAVSDPSAAAMAVAAARAQQATAAGQQAIQSMARAAQSLQALRDAQSAARAAAQTATGGAVPNGLVAGGLVVAPGAGTIPDVWVGAGKPEPTQVGGRTQVEIKQTEQKAILNWTSFNVGRETDVYFNQTAGGADASQWIALNRVTDPSLAPSRILGTIRAEGQVYVINKNGIVFGGASQVNVNSFVASSLSLSDEQFRAGINAKLSLFDDGSGNEKIAKPQFGYLGQEQPKQRLSLNDPSQVAGAEIGEAPGGVTVEAGAQLTMASGGKAMLFAPRVINNGSVLAPDGQVLMAAGEQIYLNQDLYNGVRGFEVATSAPMRWMFDYYNMMMASGQDPLSNPSVFTNDLKAIIFPEMAARAAAVGYQVVNNGMVRADHGNITLIGRSITQNGALEASTALNNRDGSIILRAWEGGMMSYASSISGGSPMKFWATGTLTLGSDSVTTAMPDLSDTSEIEQTSLGTRYATGRIEMRGKLIDIESRANVIVPAGKISIVASTWTEAGETPINGDRYLYDGSRIYIGEQAYLSVAGLQDILVTMESNVVTGDVRINELRDSPLYRESWLRGKSVSVDKRVSGLFGDGPMAGVQWVEGAPGKWVGTPLADFSGWIGVGKTTLGELSTKAGAIQLKSNGDIITRAGSLLDVSGGSVRYQDGWITTTKLVGADGRIYDIGNAMPDQLYVGFAGSFSRTHSVQGKIDTRLTETWTSIFDRGASRRFERGYVEGRDAGTIRIYAASALVLDGGYWGGTVNGERQLASGATANGGSFTIGGLGDEYGRWLIGDLIIAGHALTLPDGFTAASVLDPRWSVAPQLKPPEPDPNDPTKEKPLNPTYPVNWIEPVKKTYLDSDILAESGMATYNFFVRNSLTLAEGERLELAPAASFSVAVNSSAASTFTIDGSIRIAGGSVSFGGAKTSHFGATASIDVSGEWRNGPVGDQPVVINGGTIAAAGDFAPGVSLDVSAGGWYDPSGTKSKLKLGNAGSLTLSPTDTSQLAGLDLRGYSAASGGTLAVNTSGAVQIGGAAPIDPTVGWIPGSLFADRGFRGFALTTTGDVVVADDTVVSQVPLSVDLTKINLATVASGARLGDLGPLVVLPLAERVALKPTSLSLVGDHVIIGSGAVMRTDVGGSISLTAIGHPDSANVNVAGDVTIRGTIDAPAGAISLGAGGELTLAEGAQILARGVAVVDDRSLGGLRSGKVLAGGTVSFSGALTMTIGKGTLVDVSGASGEFDIDHGRGAPEAYTLTSSGGQIALALSGKADDLIAGEFRARSGGAGSTGGILSISVVNTLTEPTPEFSLPSPIYYINRNTGLPVALGLRASLDLYNEYSVGNDAAFRYSMVSGEIRNASTGLTQGGGLAIVNLDADATPGALSQPLASVMTAYAAQIELLNKYFYSDPEATQRIQLPTANIKLTKVSSETINNGGFGSLNVQSTAFVVAPGVNLSLGKSVTIASTINSGGAGVAQISAPYINIGTGAGSTEASGEGSIVLTADLIDITRAAFSGFAKTQLVAGDLRLGGLLTNLAIDRLASLSADGQLELKVGQVYPATGILASIKAGAQISIERNGDAALPLSAAGTLNLAAPVIVQNGVVRAPFGSITLTATDTITLGANSVTSVSGDGLVLPYGMLSNNEFWVDPTIKTVDGQPVPTLGKLPEKNIVLQGPRVTLATGSVVDIRGGGDLYGWEHVPGPGGSHDVLAPSGVYAILPGMNVSAASQNKVWLAGGNGLAAGWYALLPARYALLPGAYAISMVKGSTGTYVAGTRTLADGSTLVDGFRADAFGSGRDQLSSSWRVMSGATLRSYSEYNEAFANTYFASESFKLGQYRLTGVNVVTPRLPMDGGAVVFKATSSLVLDGTLKSQPAEGGRGGLVDIAGGKIAIVGAGQDRSDLSDYLIVDSGALSKFGAGSLLVGGVRSVDPLGLRIDVTASDVLVRNDAGNALSGPEILLAANGQVEVDDGSVIVASGNSPGAGVDLVMAPRIPGDTATAVPSRDYGALIRVSAGDAVRVLRQNVDTTTGGVVTIGSNATLVGGNALLIDATGTTVVAGSAQLSGKALSLASGRIGFGGGSSGLVLDAVSLAQLANTDALTLRSYSTMDFYTSVNLGGAGLKSVTFDSAGIVGYGSGVIAVNGDTIALQNSAGSFVSPGALGNAVLSLDANEIVLGGGAKTLRGFDAVTLTASGQIIGQGTGSLDAGTASVTMTSPLITGRGGASQSITTQNTVRVIGSGSAPIDNAEASLGTRFTFTGTNVEFGGRIVALGGAVNLSATAGNVTIGSGGLIDVGGFRKQFFDVAQFADAGSIALTATGSVIMAPGSRLNLSALTDGGAAGRLSMTSSNGGTVVLGGEIDSHAGPGQTGGSFALDIAALPDFAGISQTLNAAGFSASRQFRIRNGDVVIDGMTQVAEFSLIADRGAVTLAGTIDARSPFGGQIAVSAKNGLTMLGSALLQAGATGEFGSGRVTLEASGGDLDVRGGIIDVAGNEGGRVRFRALQSNGHTDIQVNHLEVNIVGARTSVLEGVSVYDSASGSVDAFRIDAVRDANTFIGQAGTIAGRLNTGSIIVMPGIEISSAGDLTLETDWSLADSFPTARLGSLTLRAGGNLVILGNLSDGFSAADRSGLLEDMASWDLRLVSGADLTSASALSVQSLATLSANSGSLIVGSAGAGAMVRSGTGDIGVAVGRDLSLAHLDSTIYTAGRRDTTSFADFNTPAGAVYGIEGGHLRIDVQGNATSALAADRSLKEDQLFMEWLKKSGAVDATGYFRSNQQTSWWIDFSQFKQGVGVLGGGNVSVKTGGDMSNMLVAMTSNGRMRGGRIPGEEMVLELRNGGLMDVDVGGAIRGGQYYAARGVGEIVAGEFADGKTVTVTRVPLQGVNVTELYTIAPIVALGDSVMKVRTAGNLRLQTVLDPLMLDGDSPHFGGADDTSAYMTGYTDRTSLDLTAIGGDVTLVGQGRYLSKDVTIMQSSIGADFQYSIIGRLATNLYPSMTRISALNGSVTTGTRLFTMPGRTPELRILADQDIVLGEIIMSRADPAVLPSPYRPVSGSGSLSGVLFYDNDREDIQSSPNSGFHNLLENFIDFQFTGAPKVQKSFIEANRNPARLVNADDSEPSRIFAKNGSISSNLISDDQRVRLSRIVSNEQTWLRAGTDIRNINYDLRNIHRTDVSVLEAGKDIIGGTIKMQGPGEILLAAGRDVYGETFSVVSNGNYNVYVNNRPNELTEVKGLSRDGAAITVMAGLNGKQPSYDALAAKYLDPDQLETMPDYLKLTGQELLLPDALKLALKDVSIPKYWANLFDSRDGKAHQLSTGMIQFIYDMTGEMPTLPQAYARFRALPMLTQQRFLRQVYFQELKAAGDDQNTPDANGLPRNGGYQRGYNAVDTLFPGTDWKGNIQIGVSTFLTMAGGRIETLTPGGGLQVAALGRTVPSGAGMVTIGNGDIAIFARDSVTVNRSRVLTFAGGDEVIWSTFGDIDAGRGSKTARVPSEPDVTTDDDGNTEVKEKADISGSGIGTVIGFTGVEEGDVFLIAPRGTVNAGDAGIRVSGNFTVAAQFVLNTDNIKVGRETKGMPKMENVSVNLTVETKDKAASDAVKDATQTSANERPSVIIVEVLGYGGGSTESPRQEGVESEEERRRRSGRRSYNTNSVIQLVGNGALSQEQSEALTDDEKQRLQDIAQAARGR